MSTEVERELDRVGFVSDDEARQILSRFNSSHWKNDTERARYSIPADPKRDDDIRLDAYIQQTRRLREALRVAVGALERIAKDWAMGSKTKNCCDPFTVADNALEAIKQAAPIPGKGEL